MSLMRAHLYLLPKRVNIKCLLNWFDMIFLLLWDKIHAFSFKAVCLFFSKDKQIQTDRKRESWICYTKCRTIRQTDEKLANRKLQYILFVACRAIMHLNSISIDLSYAATLCVHGQKIVHEFLNLYFKYLFLCKIFFATLQAWRFSLESKLIVVSTTRCLLLLYGNGLYFGLL